MKMRETSRDTDKKLCVNNYLEIEPLRRLGINLSVANLQAYALSQGITKSWQAMSQAEQVMLRYNYLMELTTAQQGDFARTSGKLCAA